MKERKMFVMQAEKNGGDCWSWKVENMEEGLEKASYLWNNLTKAEQEKFNVYLFEDYVLEGTDDTPELSAFDPIWCNGKKC